MTNYGEATLNIAGITGSGNFSQTGTCGATLAPGANCPISVSFSPAASGTLTGTLSVNDSVTGSPQTVTLNGTGAASGTPVLTGMCTGTTVSGGQCGAATDLADCPAGEAAISPTNMLSGNAGNYVNIDNSRGCTVKTRTEEIPNGSCATAAASASSKVAGRNSCK